MSITNQDSDTYASKVTEQPEENPVTETSENQDIAATTEQAAIEQSNESSLSNEQREHMLDQVAYIESMAKADPSILNMEEYKSMKAALEADQTTSRSVENTEEQEVEQEEVDEEDTEEISDEDDPFGVNKKSKKIEKVEFEFDDNVRDYLKKKYSIEDESKFFNSVDTWRKQAQQVNEMKTQYDAIAEDLNALPNDLKVAINAWANGQDYRQPIVNDTPNVDFRGDFDDQSKEEVVKHYYAEKVSKLQEKLDDGLIDEEDFNERFDEYYENSERLFKADKKRWDDERAKYEREINEAQKAFESSVGRSVQNLKKNYPSFSDSNVKDIEKMMANGGVEDLFYKADGSYTDEAAELLALAKFGKAYIKGIAQKAERDGETKANLDKVSKSKKTVNTGKTARPVTNNQAPKEVEHLDSVFRKDPYS